jgi:2-haloacid dehalogenase
MPLVYDVYGTLLDVDAAARKIAERDPAFAEHWAQLSANWRQRQLSYSWLRSLMGKYVPFWQITTEALDVTMGEMGLDDPALRDNLLTLYLDLQAYDEVKPELTALKNKGHQLAVLSNGNPEMLERGLASAGISPLLDAVLSVDELGVYKPDPRIYAMVTSQFDCAPEDVMFFSSNNWDVAGAGSFGFKTIWVNRAGKTWDDLPERPHHIVSSLAEAMDLIDAPSR